MRKLLSRNLLSSRGPIQRDHNPAFSVRWRRRTDRIILVVCCGCVYRKLKPGRSGDEVRQGRRVIFRRGGNGDNNTKLPAQPKPQPGQARPRPPAMDQRRSAPFWHQRTVWLVGDPAEYLTSGQVYGYVLLAPGGHVLVEVVTTTIRKRMWRDHDIDVFRRAVSNMIGKGSNHANSTKSMS
jgi:hypothetical protein